jgi:hypothetical protein
MRSGRARIRQLRLLDAGVLEEKLRVFALRGASIAQQSDDSSRVAFLLILTWLLIL